MRLRQTPTQATEVGPTAAGSHGDNEAAPPTAEDTVVDDRSECGSMRISASELSYVGGEHWAAVMETIADLRDHVDREEHLRVVDGMHDHDVPGARNPVPRHALLLYGCARASSRAEILAALPPKEAADTYISRYFDRADIVAC